MQSAHCNPIYLRTVLILSSYLFYSLSSGFFPSGHPTKTLYACPYSTISAIFLAYFIFHDFTARIYKIKIYYKNNNFFTLNGMKRRLGKIPFSVRFTELVAGLSNTGWGSKSLVTSPSSSSRKMTEHTILLKCVSLNYEQETVVVIRRTFFSLSQQAFLFRSLFCSYVKMWEAEIDIREEGTRRFYEIGHWPRCVVKTRRWTGSIKLLATPDRRTSMEVRW